MKPKVKHGKTFIEPDAHDSPVKDLPYETAQIDSERQELLDPATGRPVILRQFEFLYPPARMGQPTREQILTPGYRKYLNDMLWLDDLELIQEPKVIFSDRGFKIFVTCQARKGRIIPSEHLNAMRPLQERLHAT